jgi:hypothetical protein
MISYYRLRPWRLVADFSLRRPGFGNRPVHVGYIVDKVTLWHVFLWVIRFSSTSINPQVLHSNSIFVYLPPTLYSWYQQLMVSLRVDDAGWSSRRICTKASTYWHTRYPEVLVVNLSCCSNCCDNSLKYATQTSFYTLPKSVHVHISSNPQ